MIQVKDIYKSYGGREVLKGVSLDVKDGETISIIGGSGCGKSTFIKSVIRLIKLDRGSIRVDDRDITHIDDEYELAVIRARFGYLFQEGALFDSLTVAENVAFGLKYLTDTPVTRYRDIVREKLELVGLQGVEDMKPSELSGGMKKRVSLARSIAAEPKYILYDEPTTGLDPVTTGMVKDLILDMRAKLDITTVVVTHDLNLALEISSRVAMLYGGEFVEVSEPAMFRQSENKGVKEF